VAFDIGAKRMTLNFDLVSDAKLADEGCVSPWKPFYRRHGFENVVAGIEPVSGLTYWTFRRLSRKL